MKLYADKENVWAGTVGYQFSDLGMAQDLALAVVLRCQVQYLLESVSLVLLWGWL